MKNSYRFVVLDPPYKSFTEDQQMRHYWSEILRARFEAYQGIHGKKVMPLTPFDFYSYYVAIFDQNDRCHGAFQVILKSTCEENDLKLDINKHMFGDSDGNLPYKDAVNNWVGKQEDCAYNFHYFFLQDKDLDKDELYHIRKMQDAGFYNIYQSLGIKSVMTVGTVDLGIERKLFGYGLTRLDGLKPFEYKVTNMQISILIKEPGVSDWSEIFVQKNKPFKGLWLTREIIGEQVEEHENEEELNYIKVA